MISTYLILPSRISQLFLRDLKLSILSNYANLLKELVPYYVLLPFTLFKAGLNINERQSMTSLGVQ